MRGGDNLPLHGHGLGVERADQVADQQRHVRWLRHDLEFDGCENEASAVGDPRGECANFVSELGERIVKVRKHFLEVVVRDVVVTTRIPEARWLEVGEENVTTWGRTGLRPGERKRRTTVLQVRDIHARENPKDEVLRTE